MRHKCAINPHPHSCRPCLPQIPPATPPFILPHITPLHLHRWIPSIPSQVGFRHLCLSEADLLPPIFHSWGSLSLPASTELHSNSFKGKNLFPKCYFNQNINEIQCGSFVSNSPMLSFFHVKIWIKRLCSSFLQPKNYRKMISYHAKVTWPLFDECLKIKLRYFP